MARSARHPRPWSATALLVALLVLIGLPQQCERPMNTPAVAVATTAATAMPAGSPVAAPATAPVSDDDCCAAADLP
ncbi:hypothetical protein, partial [Kitasatospora nipponensis]|uniref:hypothetical protein n=1 Tax=Kitasatospora nipponensis TaxID=258049 RepID=UPI0031DD7A6D